LCRRRHDNHQRLLNLPERFLLQAGRFRLHRRLLQRPGDLRQMLHQRRGLRCLLQEVTGANLIRRGGKNHRGVFLLVEA